MSQTVAAAVSPLNAPVTVRHEPLLKWVGEIIELCKPDSVYW